MASKKEPGKFTIKFNLLDPLHRRVADYLETMGRSKAQFLTNAVIHYLNCPQTPDVQQPAPLDHALIETIIRRILSEETGRENIPQEVPVMKEPLVKKKIRASEDIELDDAAELLGAESMAAIIDTIAAFRNK